MTKYIGMDNSIVNQIRELQDRISYIEFNCNCNTTFIQTLLSKLRNQIVELRKEVC